MTRALDDLVRALLILAILAAGIAALILMWRRHEREPWTRDARIAADNVRISSDVPGVVSRILVTDNQFVRAGTVLFIVDDDRYAARLEQAEAAVSRTRTRADLRQARADRKLAQLDFDRSGVRAGIDGYVTGLALHPGEYAAPGELKFTLVDASSVHVVARFEEAKLPAIQVGDRARIDVLGEPRPLWGHVESLAARTDDPVATRSVDPGFTWVRVAPRIPVRIAIDQAPADMRLIAGRTATVRVQPSRPLYRN